MSGYLVRSAHPRARAPQPPVHRDGGDGDGSKRWETDLFESYRDHRVPLEVVCFDDIVLHGYLRAWERYSLLLDTAEGETLVMKHGIIRMGPRVQRPQAPTVRRVAPAPPVGS